MGGKRRLYASGLMASVALIGSTVAFSAVVSRGVESDRSSAIESELGYPSGLALAPDGRVLIADRRVHRIFALDVATGDLQPIAGTGTAGFAGDGGPAVDARLQHPEWVSVAPDGDLIIADRGNLRVRRVDAVTGRIETIAGTGAATAAADGGPAAEASLAGPFGVSVDEAGDIYVFDTEAHSIRRIDAVDGTIRTVVGDGRAGFGGDGGPGTAAQLSRPHNGVFDARARLLFGDSFNQRIRRWDPATGLIETVAGVGVEGVSPPGTPASEARFTYFGGLAVEPDGSILLTGLEGRIMRIRASDDRLEHVAGADRSGFGGDGGPARRAALRNPYGLVRLANGDIVFADAGNGRIRRIDARNGRIETIAGD